ncbi:hypothetical protein CDV55_102840 [Aspergillus turcosus]|nr:hypothetical protein CDV55_102840 [Aspergillus turcosus]
MATNPLNIAKHEELRTELFDAINSAPMWRLQAIIRDVCYQLPSAASIVFDSLLVTEDQVAVERDDDDLDSNLDSHSESESGSETSEQEGEREREPANGILEVIAPKVPKRLRSRYALCVHCKEEYDVTDNDAGSCYYHPGFPEPDDDALEEHDEWLDEDVNMQYWREQYPDKFYYPCCGRKYGDEECEIGWHEEDTTGRKKPKY